MNLANAGARVTMAVRGDRLDSTITALSPRYSHDTISANRARGSRSGWTLAIADGRRCLWDAP
jgi:hypothetical protein